MAQPPYDLWYWPDIQGRGEFVRLLMEGAGITYRDRARDGGIEAMVARMNRDEGASPFAPPFLDTGDACIAQVANILQWLEARHALTDEDAGRRAWLHAIQLTISDMVAEVHNVHHPVAMGDYYDAQKPEAARAARQFREERMPKLLGWFDAQARAEAGDWVQGARWSAADTSLFQLVAGLRYMFPKRMATIAADHPALVALHDRVAALPTIRAYLDSDRRIAFNTDGIFRHYPELDAA